MITVCVAFLKNFSIILPATILMSLAQWLLLSVISYQFGQEILGAFSVTLSLATSYIAVLSFGFRSLIISDVDYDDRAVELLLTRILFLLLALPPVVGVLMNVLTNEQKLWLVLAIFTAKIIESASDICYAEAHRTKRIQLQGISIVLRVCVAALSVMLALELFENVSASMFAIGISWLFVFLLFDFQMFRKTATTTFTQIRLNFLPFIKRAVRRGWPLSASSGLGALTYSIPNFALVYFWDERTVGSFTVIFVFIALLNLVAVSCGQAALPVLSNLMKTKQLRAFILIVFSITTVIVSGLLSFSFLVYFIHDPLVGWFFGPTATKQAFLLPLLVLLSIPLIISQFLSFATIAAGIYDALFISACNALVISCICGILFIKPYGVQGAIWVIFASGLAQLFTYSFFLTTELKRADGIAK